MDFKIDLSTMDFILERRGSPSPRATGLAVVSGNHEVAQRILMAIKTQAGAWFLDVEFGLDARGQIFKKGVDLEIVQALIREVVGSREGVLTVERLSATLGADRVLNVDLQVVTDEGETVTLAFDLLQLV